MIYQEALDWIHGQLKFGIKPGLERVWMLEELGNPQDNLKAVHIVGTNGKDLLSMPYKRFFSKPAMKLEHLPSPYIIDFKETHFYQWSDDFKKRIYLAWLSVLNSGG